MAFRGPVRPFPGRFRPGNRHLSLITTAMILICGVSASGGAVRGENGRGMGLLPGERLPGSLGDAGQFGVGSGVGGRPVGPSAFWTPFDSQVLPGLALAASEVHDRVLYVAGGATHAGYTNRIFAYEESGVTWNELTDGVAPFPWSARAGHQLVYHDSQYYLMGGLDDDKQYLNDVWTSDDMIKWNKMSLENQWSPRANFGAVEMSDTLVVVGGEPGTNGKYSGEVWTLKAGSSSWSRSPQGGWPSPARASMGLTVDSDGYAWLFGGHVDTANAQAMDDVWRTKDAQVWTKITASAGIGARYDPVSVYYMGRLWVIGGTGPNGESDLKSFWSSDGTSWNEVPDVPTDAASLSGAAANTFFNEIWIVNGQLGKTYSTTFYTFDPCIAENCSMDHDNPQFVCALVFPNNLSTGCVCRNGLHTADCKAAPTPGPHGPGKIPWIIVGSAGGVALVVIIACVYVVATRKSGQGAYLKLSDGSDIGEEWLINPKALKLEEKPIGAGGFAQVYRGTLEGAPVAVKQIHGYLMATKDREILYAGRFKAEAAMMARLYHPHLQGLVGLALQPTLCLVTEFADHGSLADVMGTASHDMVETRTALKIMHQVASGVHFLHTRNPRIVHRDLNPNNVLVYSIEHSTLDVKVADFGLSKEVELEQTMTGFLGSPSYIAPEILTDSASYDEKVDMYSFGVMLWAVARYIEAAQDIDSGKAVPSNEDFRGYLTPYKGMSPWQIIARVKDGQRPTVPRCDEAPVLRTLMEAAWAGDPADRPTFGEVLDSLERAEPTLCDPVLSKPLGETSMIPDTFIGRVAPGLMVSSLNGVRSVSNMRRPEVTHILNTARRTSGTSYPATAKTMTLNIDDEPDQDLLSVLPKAMTFIEEGRRDGGCLVHCLAGTSRSVSIVTAYLMCAYDLRDDAALQLVTDRHPQARPNPGFRKQLHTLNQRDHPKRVAAVRAIEKVQRGQELLPLINAQMRRTALMQSKKTGTGFAGFFSSATGRAPSGHAHAAVKFDETSDSESGSSEYSTDESDSGEEKGYRPPHVAGATPPRDITRSRVDSGRYDPQRSGAAMYSTGGSSSHRDSDVGSAPATVAMGRLSH